MDFLTIYNSEKTKSRIGNKTQDGGYIIAELENEYDGFISCGIAQDISFEIELLNVYPSLNCLAFDGTINSLPQIHKRIKFFKKNVSNINSDTTTNLVEHILGSNIFLKMDIEGFEFKVLPVIIENNLLKNFKQMVIEFHTPEDIKKHTGYYSRDLHSVSNETMESIIREINKTHTLIHFHGNPGPGTHILNNIVIPNVFECTFVRNDFIKEKIKNKRPVPTPIDKPNLPEYKEIDLNYYPFVN